MALNGISTETVTSGGHVDAVATKLKRRDDKLRIASYQRQGYVGSMAGSTRGYTVNSPYGYVGSNLHNIGSSSPAYRTHNVITQTHQAYVGSNATLHTVSGTGSPDVAHPWD